MVPRTIRELEQMDPAEALAYWGSLTGREQHCLANAMTPEEVEAMPSDVKDTLRSQSITTLQEALIELDAELAEDGKFIHITEDGETVEMTQEYCRNTLLLLLDGFDEESEASLGFYIYHTQRLWIEAYELLLKERRKADIGLRVVK